MRGMKGVSSEGHGICNGTWLEGDHCVFSTSNSVKHCRISNCIKVLTRIKQESINFDKKKRLQSKKSLLQYMDCLHNLYMHYQFISTNKITN